MTHAMMQAMEIIIDQKLTELLGILHAQQQSSFALHAQVDSDHHDANGSLDNYAIPLPASGEQVNFNLPMDNNFNYEYHAG